MAQTTRPLSIRPSILSRALDQPTATNRCGVSLTPDFKCDDQPESRNFHVENTLTPPTALCPDVFGRPAWGATVHVVRRVFVAFSCALLLALDAAPQEDCVSFNPVTAQVATINSSWKVVDGDHWLLDFGGRQIDANKALEIIKHYHMNQICFVGRPSPDGGHLMMYFKTVNGVPEGPFTGEDAVAIDPRSVEARWIHDSWKVVQGDMGILDFGDSEANARLATSIIKQYGFQFQCFVVRPNAPMMYFRKTATATEPPPVVDADGDGIGDNIEDQLLQKFSPYYLFSKDKVDGHLTEEHYNPADVWWYLQLSELLPSGDEDDDPVLGNATLAANPEALLFPLSDITSYSWKGSYYVNPLQKAHGVSGDPGRHGRDWGYVLAKKNVGLYGHVVRANRGYRRGQIQQDDNSYTYYKIEYWQFFGYNNANAALKFGDHEGDWATVQLLYDPTQDTIAKVYHYAHGKEMVFDMAAATCHTAGAADWGSYQEFRGLNYGRSFTDAGDTASNNTVRFYPDPDSQEYSHPVVYIEYGSHEFWPTERGTYHAYWHSIDIGQAPPHRGDDLNHRYLTRSVPNLGEVERKTMIGPEARVILQYNGYWGAFGRKNHSPPGPPLHTEWTWPADSVIRPGLTVSLPGNGNMTCLEN